MTEQDNKIKFRDFYVKKLEFNLHDSCEKHSEESLRLKPKVFWKVGTGKENSNEYCVILGCTIFKDDEQAPFEFIIEVAGSFLAEGEPNKNDLEIFALTSLFPYLSGLISQTLAIVQNNIAIMSRLDIKRLVEEAKPEESDK